MGASEAARALGVSLDTIRRWDRAGKIATERDSANRRLIAVEEIDRLRQAPSRARSDETISARNHLRGVVTAVEVDGLIARVEIDVTTPARIVALVTREAVLELGLEPGVEASGVVKATSVMIER